MNVLHGTWDSVRGPLTAAPLALAARLRRTVRAISDERKTRLAIRQLESLPGPVLKDIGVRRDEIPLAVERAKRKGTGKL